MYKIRRFYVLKFKLKNLYRSWEHKYKLKLYIAKKCAHKRFFFMIVFYNMKESDSSLYCYISLKLLIKYYFMVLQLYFLNSSAQHPENTVLSPSPPKKRKETRKKKTFVRHRLWHTFRQIQNNLTKLHGLND